MHREIWEEGCNTNAGSAVHDKFALATSISEVTKVVPSGQASISRGVAQLLEGIFSDLRKALGCIEEKAQDRRMPRTDDAVADGIEYAVRLIRIAIDEIDRDHEYLTSDECALLHGVTSQAVTSWCRSGELDGVETPKGWLIKRSAQRQRKVRSRSA